MDKLLEKLMLSKAIMDKSDGISRGQSSSSSLPNNINVQNFDAPQAKYNIPNDVLSEHKEQPVRTSTTKTPTIDAIKNSKLPDEIKRLMIEHPIVQPQQQSTNVLSNELVEKASRLMKEKSNNYVPESATSKPKTTSSSGQFDYNLIKQMIRESVEDVLKENGVISESSEKSNEFFSFKVGKHIFEGKVTKIKKTQ